MKKFFTLLFAVALVSMAYSQYTETQSLGTNPPYNWDEPTATNIINNPANDVLSATQTLPFNFNFYGNTMTQYKASDNGYITFDAAATTSFASNTSIPNVRRAELSHLRIVG